METRILTTDNITEAADTILQGEVLVFPTETVYGIGANVYNVEAIKKIFHAKGRPSDNPLIIHIADYSQMDDVADMRSVDRNLIKKICDAFWPGPLTLILPKNEKIFQEVTGGLPTVAVRMPHHPFVLNLIKISGVPIAAPSANISGKPSGTCFEHVYHDLNGKVAGIVQSDMCELGIESTVLDITTHPPLILRPGVVTLEQLKPYLPDISFVQDDTKAAHRSPGTKYKHYTPDAQIVLFESSAHDLIPMYHKKYTEEGLNVTIIYAENTQAFAQKLFKSFRDADEQHVHYILIAATDESGQGKAIMNRIRKAASKIIT
jgi:L-threonylcarbamoyladenylate synthase